MRKVKENLKHDCFLAWVKAQPEQLKIRKLSKPENIISLRNTKACLKFPGCEKKFWICDNLAQLIKERYGKRICHSPDNVELPHSSLNVSLCITFLIFILARIPFHTCPAFLLNILTLSLSSLQKQLYYLSCLSEYISLKQKSILSERD